MYSTSSLLLSAQKLASAKSQVSQYKHEIIHTIFITPAKNVLETYIEITLSVCLFINGWIDIDETLHGCIIRPENVDERR